MKPHPAIVYQRRRRRALGTLLVLLLFGVFVVHSLATPEPGPWDFKVGVTETDADLSKRLTAMPGQLFTSKAPPRGTQVIRVNDGVGYQRIQGVGGAMTDSAAYLIRKQLGSSTQAKLLNNLFSPTAAGLDFVRLPIAASDFTVGGAPYSYDDLPSGQSDPDLVHFTIDHDDAYIVPAMRDVLKINSKTKVIATAWSPPPWMKTNDTYNNLGFSGHLLPGDWPLLAQYFVKFVQAYAKRGIPISAVTPENEPRAPADYPSMSFTADNESKWIAQDLRPALKKAKLPTKVFGGEVSFSSGDYLLDLSRVKKSGLDGLSTHCYRGVPYVLSQLHATNPGLRLVVSECAIDITPYTASEIVIASMRNWASAVGLWNLALDPNGGPVQHPNTGCGNCKGIVTIDPSTHSVTYNLAYYQLGQIGRFVRPGAQRVDTNHFVSYYVGTGHNHYGASRGVDDVAVRNPDGSLALVVYNNTASPARFAVEWKGRYITDTLPSHATVTFAWNR
jgi:glucosylceramidase